MNQRLTEEELIAIRRDLHAHPELSHHEARTSGRVVELLSDSTLKLHTGVAGHGVVADVVGPHPGPTLLFRADMDALPIQEVGGRDYGSTNPGVMHACGHDVHTTVGIGVARAVAARQSEVNGTVRFVFQPAEEAAPPPGQSIGAELMVEEGTLDGVDAAFALHCMPSLNVGSLGWTGGPVWAASDLFDIDVSGSMAHGAYPHEGRDALLAAAQIVNALQQVTSRNVDTRDPCVLSVCRIGSGQAYNIVPDAASLQGLLRTHSEEARSLALRRMAEIVKGTAEAYGCTATLRTVRGTYQTANHPQLERAVGALVQEHHPDVRWEAFKPQMGAEDFAAFSRRVPGCYLFLGVRNEARGIVHPIHTPEFDVDERALGIGVRTMTDTLLSAGARWAEISQQL
jgi:amidohydrolase